MKLPVDYLETVLAGATALHAIGTELRAAASRSNVPELWLSVRDYEGLAARLVGTSEWEWRHGFAGLLIAPQDFAVMAEVLGEGDSVAVLVSPTQASAVAALKTFLERYEADEYEFDEPPNPR